MSGVYLPNMEIPKKPGAYSMKIRLFVKEDGTASIWGLEEYIPHEPLDIIPVPSHGRLIEADIPEDDRQVYGFYQDYDLQQLLDSRPTVIPGDKEAAGQRWTEGRSDGH